MKEKNLSLVLNFLLVYRYQLAENIDSQLKQMSEDLKEIIEHLNESSRSEDVNDPVSAFIHFPNYN